PCAAVCRSAAAGDRRRSARISSPTARARLGGMTTPRPYTLVAELTYRCPLRCVYCSNPVDFARDSSELSTEEWCRTFSQAAALGVVQVHLSGGEPAVRPDLATLVSHARGCDLYSNMF